MRSPLLSLLPAVLMCAGASWAACPTNVDWVEFEGSCYWRSTYPATWTAAVDACPTVGAGSTLASIHSLVENAFVMGTYNYAETWIGLNDRGTEGSFVWVDGSALDFQNWQPGEPNNNHDQDCVQVPHPDDPTAARWDDDHCENSFHFLCKMPATN